MITKRTYIVCDPYTDRHVYPIGYAIGDRGEAVSIVGEINSQGGTPEQQRSLADQFVRAVNAHEDLVAALRRAINHLIMTGTKNIDAPEALAQARAAITKAGGEV